MCRANAFYIWSPVGELLMLWCGGHSWAPRFWRVWCASGGNKRRMVKVPAAVLASRKLWTERWRGTARGWAVWRWHSSSWCLYWAILLHSSVLLVASGTKATIQPGTSRPRPSRGQGQLWGQGIPRFRDGERPDRMQVDGFLVQKGIWKSVCLKITFGQVSWGCKGGHSTVSFVYKACWWWFSQSVLWYYMISQIFTRSHRRVTKDKLYLGRFLLGSVAFPNEIEAQSSCDLEVIDPFHTAFSRYIDSSRRLFVKSICCCTYTPEWTLVPLLSRVPIHQPAGEISKRTWDACALQWRVFLWPAFWPPPPSFNGCLWGSSWAGLASSGTLFVIT